MKDPLLLLSRVVASSDGRLSDVLRGRILATLRRSAGAELDVIIREHEEPRSLDQNAYLHAEPFPKIADYMGEDIEGAKLILMGECWGWKYSAKFGRQIPVKPRTSSMTKAECTYFIEWLLPWAVEHCDGLQVMLPDEWQRSTAA